MQLFTFDIPQLTDGISFVAVAMGMFGLAEIIRNLEQEENRSTIITQITSFLSLNTGNRLYLNQKFFPRKAFYHHQGAGRKILR